MNLRIESSKSRLKALVLRVISLFVTPGHQRYPSRRDGSGQDSAVHSVSVPRRGEARRVGTLSRRVARVYAAQLATRDAEICARFQSGKFMRKLFTSGF